MSSIRYADGQDSIIPKPSNPFYIVTPAYLRISAGITALHILCHYLNVQGFSAYIVHYPPQSEAGGALPAFARPQKTGEFPAGLQAPLITQQVLDHYDEARLTPIVIYPEVYDNPFKAAFFARYILNYPGLLAPTPVQEADHQFAYSRILADSVGCEDVLYISTADLSYWNTSGAAQRRSGSCFYAGKTRLVLKGTPAGVPADSTEILSSSLMSRDDVRSLFWRSEVFYCFEDTALATEACLCGCPVVFVKTEHFSGVPLASVELTDAGSCILGEAGGLARAKASLADYDALIRATFAEAPRKIAEIGTRLTEKVAQRPYLGTITFPYEPQIVYMEPTSSPVGDIWIAEQAASTPPPAAAPAPQAALPTHAAPPAVAAEPAEIVHLTPAPVPTPLPDSPSEHLTGEVSALRAEVTALRSSTSWKITAPLRAIVTRFR